MLKTVMTVCAAAALTVACGQTDAGITTNVKNRLAAENTVQAEQIDVDTNNGVVTLTGTVESESARQQAVMIARNTDGVRDVIDQLRVDATAPTTGIGPGVDTPDGGASISDRAGEAVDRTGGAAGAAVTDAALTTMVKTKLLADETVKGLDINVDTSDGVVTLSGRVSSQAEADRAQELARDTDGVRQVVSNLRVGS